MVKRDCYYFSEVQDMNAYIPCCALQSLLGRCPCYTEKSYDCTQYISRTDVDKLVKEHLKNRKSDKE
jgi:hypothetical protein